MKNALAKQTTLQIERVVQEISAPKRKRIPGIPTEDLMETAADYLEDPWARSFFTTVSGFARLTKLLTDDTQNVFSWLEKQFPEAKENEKIKQAIQMIAQKSLESINLNITLKRMTAILTQAERAVLAEGLLDQISLEANINPEKMTLIESLLTKLLLSEEAAIDLIENWRRKRKP